MNAIGWPVLWALAVLLGACGGLLIVNHRDR